MPSSSKGFDGILDMTAARGYDIDFGTLQGQEHFAKPYTFISRVHTLGPGVPIEVEVREYLRMTEWDIAKGFGPVLQTTRTRRLVPYEVETET